MEHSDTALLCPTPLTDTLKPEKPTRHGPVNERTVRSVWRERHKRCRVLQRVCGKTMEVTQRAAQRKKPFTVYC